MMGGGGWIISGQDVREPGCTCGGVGYGQHLSTCPVVDPIRCRWCGGDKDGSWSHRAEGCTPYVDPADR